MPLDIRGRLALVQAGTSLGCALLVTLLIWAAEIYSEQNARQRFLEQALDGFLASSTMDAASAAPLGLQFFRPAAQPGLSAPRELSHLGEGFHGSVRIGEAQYAVLVRQVAPGDLAYTVYQRRMRYFAAPAAVVVLPAALLAALLSWLVGRWGTARALVPLERLLARIRRLRPALRRQRLEVEADDGELRAIIDALNDFMRELDQVRDRERIFASAASHELRTPLTVIRGAAEVLATLPQVPPQILARIQQSVTHATNDLDALLSLAQGRELPPAERLRLDELLPRLAEPFAEQARAQGTRVSWTFQGPTELQASPAVLGLIFTNLLRHALRSSPGGEVQIRVEGGTLVMRDDGAYAPPERLLNAFEPDTEGRQGATGLGLYIAKTLADRKGWGLVFRSIAGGAREAVLLLSATARTPSEA